MPPRHGYLLLRNGDNVVELINHARTAAYLQQPDLAIDGIDICNVLDDGGCPAYARVPYDVDFGWAAFPGSNGNALYTADSDDYSLTPDGLTAVVGVRVSSWSPGVAQVMMAHRSPSGSPWWQIQVNAAGTLQWQYNDGTTITSNVVPAVVVNGLPTNEWVYLAGVLIPDTGSGRRISFYRGSTPHGPWTFLGTLTSAAVAPINPSAPLVIGATLANGSGSFTGDIRYAALYQGTGGDFPGDDQPGGDLVFEFDGTEIVGDSASFVASTGQTVNVARGTTPLVLHPRTNAVGIYSDDYWPLINFAAPDVDPAPWYNENEPASADALGFFVTEWTGLGNEHVTRGMAPRGGYGGGAILGPMGAQGRVQKLNVVLLARSEEAMQYLFDWLSDTLIAACSACADDTLLFYRFCPDVEDPRRALGEQRRVGLIEAPRWEADVAGRGQCFLRLASFTIAAGDPCIYLPATTPEPSEADYVADLPACFLDPDTYLSPSRFPCRPSCSELIEDCRTSLTINIDAARPVAPVVCFSNDDAEASYPLRAVVYADPQGIGTLPNPCGLPILGEIYVRSLPPYSQFVWDVAGKTTWFADVTTGGDVDGWPYIDMNDPPVPRFFAANCGTIHVVLEPATLCADIDGSDVVIPAADLVFTDPHYPAVTVRMQERTGCP